ncbi:MAG: DUF3179 domain-containing (seleno)protein [Acidimicrobiales bacterium]
MRLRPVRAGCAVVVVVLLAACSGGSGGRRSDGAAFRPYPYPAAPAAPTGSLDAVVEGALERLAASLGGGGLDRAALDGVAGSGDARLGWFVADLLRFVSGGDDERALVAAFVQLTGVDPAPDPAFAASPWQSITNHLIAWDLPAQPGYREHKALLFEQVEPGWGPFFDDPRSDIDWRLVSWGGVLIDDRPLGDRRGCARGCIPALDDPVLTDASEGDWYGDDRLVFGVVVGGEAVAFPKNIMQVHEMVNVTIGGRRLAIPYCTLCGSAQAYFTDSAADGPGALVLRTSGLLSRSNKVMYDLTTRSVFDTFTGRAVSGPLHDAGVVHDQATLEVSRWGDCKHAHSGTRIVARDGGIGRSYPDDPLQGRDDNGPIFPIGPADPRLPVQAPVLGVIGPDGTPIAFPVDQATAALADRKPVAVGPVEVVADGSGLRARVQGGDELATHEAFWFAWSQFHPDTIVWTPLSR